MAAPKTYILIDHSGSMASLWDEAIGAVNGYVEKLPDDSYVQVDVFDSGDDWYTNIRDGKKNGIKPIDPTEVSPRGMTALNDAAGRLLTQVLSKKAKKAVVVIMTDGLENSSKEFSSDQVKALLDKAKDRGYEMIFLGANFDQVEQQARMLGVAMDKTMNISRSKLSASMRNLGEMTTSYYSTGAAMSLSDDVKAKANA